MAARGPDSHITYDYSELATQMLGDLELEEQTRRFWRELEKLKALALMNAFLRSFLDVDEAVRDNPTLANPESLLNSNQWASLRNAARHLSALPNASPYREAG